jgi:diguanylate cyclase (GGDEF)-like protein
MNKPVTRPAPSTTAPIQAPSMMQDPREFQRLPVSDPEALARLRRAEVAHKNAHISLAAGLIGVAVVGVWLSRTLPGAGLAGWAIAAALVYAVRFGLALSFGKRVGNQPDRAGPALTLLAVTVIVSGLLWGGLGVWAVVSAGMTDAVIVVAVAALLAVAVMAVYAAAPLAAGGFAGAALVPPAVCLLLAGGPQQSLVAAILLVLTVVIGIGLWLLSPALTRGLRDQAETMRLESRIKGLSDELTQTQLNLKVAQQRVTETSSELSTTYHDLTSTRRQVQSLQKQLEDTSLTDPETGLANQVYFEQVLDNEWRRAIRIKRPLTLIVCDLDEFDTYRSVHGDEIANATIKRAAQRIKEVVNRAGDVAARIDQNKFALVLPATPSKFAGQFAEQLRKAIEDLQIPFSVPNASRKLVTASLGVSSSIPGPESISQELLDRINAALYEATFRGGNRVLGYRALDSLRVERWDENKEGKVSLEALGHKLSLQGYTVKRQVYAARASLGDQRIDHDSARAVFSGEVSFNVEGMDVQLRAGDVVYIPAGSTVSAEVLVDQSTVVLEGVKVPQENDL